LKTCFEYSRFGWQVSSFHWTAILNACHNTHNTPKKQQCLNQHVGMWNHLTPWNLKTSPWRKKYPAFFFLLSFGLAASCFQDVSKCIFMYLYVSSWRGAKDTKRYVISKCIFLYLPPRGPKIPKDTSYLNVSFCIFCPGSGRYIKIQKDTFRYI
jgi:hypothetical protein